jgi:preprotein translocase subunit SecG
MFKFFLVVHTLIAASLVGVILMQRSEGGGFAGGGSPTSLLSARGAGDFLTRTTAILATLFITMSIGLAAMATINRAPAKLDDSLKRVAPANSVIPTLPGAAPAGPLGGAPATGSAPVPTQGSAIPALAPKAEEQPTPAAPRLEKPVRLPLKADGQPTQLRPSVRSDKPAPQPVVMPRIVTPTPKAETPSAPSLPKGDPVTPATTLKVGPPATDSATGTTPPQ